MHQRNQRIDDDALPVIVPRNDRRLVPTSPERVQRLRQHLVRLLRAVKPADPLPPTPPEPGGFGAQVTRIACSLCRGWCCRNGDDDAFLDEQTMGRVRRATPTLDARTVLQLYVERVPAMGYEGSCLFHGKQGCTLDRSLRSDLCNAYFCGGLQTYLTSGDEAGPTVVIAGKGDHMRTSPVIMPTEKTASLFTE